jgi:predicted molibdopterin-dependent oxidoreductase YjgC
MASRSRLFPALPGALWKSRGQLRFGLDVVRYGVCDACSLGSHGLTDSRGQGVHLCGLRLEQLSRWTCGALRIEELPDMATLRSLDADSLRSMGRLPFPMLRRAGADRFTAIQWHDADKLIASRLADHPDRWSLWLDSKSSSNEGYFAFHRLAEDLRARRHSLLVSLGYKRCQEALFDCFGASASTASLADIEHADLILVCGDVGSDHPLLPQWLEQARSRGAELLALGGSSIGVGAIDIECRSGAEEQLLAGSLKAALGDGAAPHQARLKEQVADLAALQAHVERWQWPELELAAGSTRRHMEALAASLSKAERVVIILADEFAASEDGAARIRTLLALAVAGGAVGRPGSGILTLGGGSAGQGAQDCGIPLSAVPEQVALGEDQLLYSVGTALSDGLDSSAFMPEVLSELPVRVHQGHFLDPSMLLDATEFTLLLPMQSRYEQRGGATVTSMDRWIRFSPEVRGHPIGEARPDWQIPAELVTRIGEVFSDRWAWPGAANIRGAMDKAIPRYEGIVDLHAPTHALQWGGTTLHSDGFATEDGLAHVDLSALR